LSVILILFGVSGSGKTTIGRQLADALSIPFFDADDFHPPSNIKKMRSARPLDDADRQPWLETLATSIADWQEQGGAVLACSALRETYRETLGSRCGENICWVLLQGSEEVLADRLKGRKGHFFDRQLLNSQLDTLEVPDYGWLVDIESSPQEIVNKILTRLRSR
jgi:6-phosphogluconate dehydrogenase/gluconokinase